MGPIDIKDYHEEFIEEVENNLNSFQCLLKDLKGSEEIAREVIPQIKNAILPIKGDSEASENQKFANICNNLISYLESADGETLVDILDTTEEFLRALQKTVKDIAGKEFNLEESVRGIPFYIQETMVFAKKLYLKEFVGDHFSMRFFGEFAEIKGDIGKKEKEILLVEYGQSPDELLKINPELILIFILGPNDYTIEDTSDRYHFIKKNQSFQKNLKKLVESLIA